jgi:dTDP-glucose pyrophosphorylase
MSLEDVQNITVLIPAAGRVPEGVLSLSNIACPALIPIAGRPVIHWTINYLRSLGLRKYVIAVSRRGMFVEDFVDCAFGQDCEIDFIVPSHDGGVGTTVKELFDCVKTESALVVLGDTSFQFDDAALLNETSPFVLVHPVEASYRWCIAEKNGDGFVSRFRDKEPDLPVPLDALIGVYFFPNINKAKDAANKAVEGANKRVELSAILDNLRIETPIKVIKTGDWLDVGNADKQELSHQALLQKRAFNELHIDPMLGTITKRSRNIEKFIDEINYLRLLPQELSILFPRVLNYSTDWNDAFVTIEYYGYPTLAEVFVFENVEPSIWQQIFVHLQEIITNGFMRWQRPLPKGTLRKMYIEKTRERLENLQASSDLLSLVRHEGTINVNGKELKNLPLLWKSLEEKFTAMEENTNGHIIHGDLCLTNILYDLRSRICKLIDPRGSFGAAGIFGDTRYDLAKLYHSVYGLYDFIINDLFRVSVKGTDVTLDIRTSPRHKEICERFESVFFPHFNREEVLLVTAMLFASMPALHYDAPQRQTAMYIRTLQLLDEVFG